MSLNLELPPLADDPIEPEPTDQDVLEVQQRARAETDGVRAKTEDTRTSTELKRSLSAHVLWLMWLWFIALWTVVAFYMCEQFDYSREVPPEVIIALLTSTTVVVGLVGYILKGLFNVRE
ncbi:hypothetical protein ACFO3I_07775 [Rheinheimera marina]|uniref:Uncharacterized protein n=1 Tax=Rheinheimera marina TaxID=1774958 RepID=A0ABV9JKW7_9GAMM